jgi:hypothetical protein
VTNALTKFTPRTRTSPSRRTASRKRAQRPEEVSQRPYGFQKAHTERFSGRMEGDYGASEISRDKEERALFVAHNSILRSDRSTYVLFCYNADPCTCSLRCSLYSLLIQLLYLEAKIELIFLLPLPHVRILTLPVPLLAIRRWPVRLLPKLLSVQTKHVLVDMASGYFIAICVQ